VDGEASLFEQRPRRLLTPGRAQPFAALSGTPLSLLPITQPTIRVSIVALVALAFIYAAGPVMAIAGAVWLIRRMRGGKR
jgi:hypothetical protein